jgi:hypothetical protein
VAADRQRQITHLQASSRVALQRLARTVDDLAPSLASGELAPNLRVLCELLDVCVREHLYAQEARLRRWLNLPGREWSDYAW